MELTIGKTSEIILHWPLEQLSVLVPEMIGVAPERQMLNRVDHLVFILLSFDD